MAASGGGGCSRGTSSLPHGSHRKQIARQPRTQYVDGINSNPVTLKSELEVNEGHVPFESFGAVSYSSWRYLVSFTRYTDLFVEIGEFLYPTCT